ncbi:hypothetical protein PENCOP_c005G07528 [Penicillium coprophilum]|uniref:F-box domain-containing protein n=1 Tax=Penicillium coprophilum TaxID=36646 RepID=A0A1V6UR87_9EURO|nr:hypothetical protein PENCOP_c005G07528 [Penicillium coprophilum]
MDFLQSHPDVSYLVFQLLESKDLKDICLLSKSCNALATPLLYRSVVLEFEVGWRYQPAGPQEKIFLFSSLLSHLLDDGNAHVRSLVRDVTVRQSMYTNDWKHVVSEFELSHDVLSALLERLPNVQNIYLYRGSENIALTPALLDTIASHDCKPHLHLRDERGQTPVDMPMPMVRSLKVQEDKEDLDRLLGACPNLRDLSYTTLSHAILRFASVRDRRRPPGPSHRPYVLTPVPRIPPLESMLLQGLHLNPDQASWWRNGFPSNSLKSLTLGPEDNKGVLEVLSHCSLSLRSFEISTWYSARDKETKDKAIDAFLLSFNTLETLIVKGYSPSIAAIGNHRSLKSLCLHQIEELDERRESLSINELKTIDEFCPDLEHLEFDIIQSQKGEWPQNFITAFITNFPHLRSLKFHVAFGLRSRFSAEEVSDYDNGENASDNKKNPITDWIIPRDGCVKLGEQMSKVLTNSSVKAFLDILTDRDSSLKLRKLTLESGEGEWGPRFAYTELKRARIFKVSLPLDGNSLPVVKRKYFFQ